MFIFYATVFVTGLLAYYLWKLDDNPKAPPGPRPWPILGNLVHLARASDDLTRTFSELSKVYGEIFSIKMGMKSTVILTSREAIETVTTNEGLLGRDRSGVLSDRSLGRNLGVATADGEIWEKSRAWTFRNLREFGFGKSSEMEHYIHNAASDLYSQIDEIQKRKGFVETELLFSLSIFAIMWQMITNSLTEGDTSDIKTLAKKSEGFVRSSMFGAGLTNAFPFLRFIFPESTGYNVQMDFFTTCNKVAEKIYNEKRSNMHTGPPSCFAEAFVSNAEKDTQVFSNENFQIIFQDLMIGSSETTNGYMEAVVLLLMLNPDAQEKVYQEILEVSPNGGIINFSDRKKMVYTQAVLLESHRFGRSLQNFVPRKALKDIVYKDYIIKKGTVTIVDSYSYYNDEKLWVNPESFHPERFINEKGEICNANDIISFGFGKRNCPGEQYAGVLSFILLTSLVQRYRILNPPGQPKPKTDMRPGFTFRPFPYQACFIPRT